MKNSCLFLLAVLIGLSVYYHTLTEGTGLEGAWWTGILLALGVTLTLANLQGVYMAFRRKVASGKEPGRWKDGELVGLSGRVSAVRDPLIAPFSGKSAVIAEYSLKIRRRSGKNSTTVNCYSGMLMTPCSIHTRRGPVKIVGFPMLPPNDAQILSDDMYRKNAAIFISSTKFEKAPSNPIALIRKFNEHLKDDDGDVSGNYRYDEALSLEDDHTDPFPPGDNGYAEEDGEFDGGRRTESGDLTPEATRIYNKLWSMPYILEETAIFQGDEIAVFGTWDAKKQTLNVGSGLKKIHHSLQRGNLESAIRKMMIQSVIFTVIFGTATFYGHLYFLDKVKENLPAEIRSILPL